jgi:hypothetical protein
MKKALALTQTEFESSTGHTPEYMAWHRTFKREFTKYLKSLGVVEVKIGSPNHFDMSGFFKREDGQWFYFSISDIRWSKDDMLLRTAKHEKDYTGGANYFVPLIGYDRFNDRFASLVKSLRAVDAPVFN